MTQTTLPRWLHMARAMWLPLDSSACHAGWICVGLGASFQTATAIMLVALRHQIGGWFVSDPRVQQAVASIAPLAALFQVGTGVADRLQSVPRAAAGPLTLAGCLQIPDGVLGTSGGVASLPQ